jgi:hypothetical protein
MWYVAKPRNAQGERLLIDLQQKKEEQARVARHGLRLVEVEGGAATSAQV